MSILYELSEAYRGIEELLDAEGCNQEELEARLAVIEGHIAERVDGLAAVIATRERLAEAAKAEKDRLANREAKYLRDAERLIEWLQKFLESQKIEKPIKGTRFTVGLKKCPPSVRILDEYSVPPWFMRTVPEKKEIDKAAILEQYRESGEIVPGTDIVQRTTLNIK